MPPYSVHAYIFQPYLTMVKYKQVQYHADFEKAKGKFTQVADDPETLRIKANTKIIRFVPVFAQNAK